MKKSEEYTLEELEQELAESAKGPFVMNIEPLDDADEWAAADTYSERCMLTMDDMCNINGYE